MELQVKWQNVKTNEWIEFDLSDINASSRDLAISLFSNKVPVIAKHDEFYIVNSKVLLKQYQHNRRKVSLFSDLQPNSGSLQTVGFI